MRTGSLVVHVRGRLPGPDPVHRDHRAVRHLDNILAGKYKPTTVGAVVTRSLVFTDPMMTTHLGFLTDDDYSLTDRTFLDQTQ